jgi:hypothetical protein
MERVAAAVQERLCAQLDAFCEEHGIAVIEDTRGLERVMMAGQWALVPDDFPDDDAQQLRDAETAYFSDRFALFLRALLMSCNSECIAFHRHTIVTIFHHQGETGLDMAWLEVWIPLPTDAWQALWADERRRNRNGHHLVADDPLYMDTCQEVWTACRQRLNPPVIAEVFGN